MRAVIRRCGNSAAIRSSASVLAAARFAPEQAAVVREEGGRVISVPARDEPVYGLDTPLAGVTPGNLHPGEGTGPPRGREVW